MLSVIRFQQCSGQGVAVCLQLFSFSGVYAKEQPNAFSYSVSAVFLPKSSRMRSVIQFQQCPSQRAAERFQFFSFSGDHVNE